MLDSTRIKAAEALFAELLVLPAPEREKQLRERCGADPPLANFVRQLLKHDDSGMGGFLAGPTGADGRVESNWHPLPKNTRVGNFQLLRRIGEGGMGIVYEARQAHPDRIVALKVIRGGRFIDRTAVKLFQREVQALARLRHPCIGAIYEAGGTDDEQHFFAMELVEGRPLIEHVRETRMVPRDRLALFCRICDAIHYAHQRGVTHRDLKPSNILIDAEGLPRILDFGLARITDAELGLDVSRTMPGRIQGTLAYMSPEQARGDSNEIDTRSDVYSLGVILYELLTDRLPYDVTELLLPRAVETICNQPPRQSASLKRDLETIAWRALEKEPHRRYASAAALGEDVQRYLTNQPIEAKRDSAWYVLRKALIRHRVAASVVVAFIVIVSISAVALAVMYQRQAAERERAEMETQKALEAQNQSEAFARFMEKMFEGVGPSVAKGRDAKLMKEMMDAAAQRIESGELKDVPAAEFRLRDSISEVYMDLGEHDAAERITTPMVELAKRGFGPVSHEYAMALDSHASWLHAMGRFEEGMAEAEEALSIYRQIHPGDHEFTVDALNRLGSFQISRGRPADALIRHEEALAMSRRLYPGDFYQVAISMSKYGDALAQLGRFADALPRHQEALEMFRRLNPGDDPDVTIGLNRVANDLTNLGRPAEALPLFEEALAIRRRLFPGDHPRVGESLYQLSNCLLSLSRPAYALPILEEAAPMARRLFPGDHQFVGTVLTYHGTCLVALDRADEGLPKLGESVAMFRKLFSGDHPQTAWALTKHALGLAAVERHADALAEFEEAQAMVKRMFPNDHPTVASCMINTASGLQSMGRLDDALKQIETAEGMMSRIHPATHPDLRAAEIRRGSILVDLQRIDEAEETLVPIWNDIGNRADVRTINKVQCLSALVKLFETRDRSEPGHGFDAKASAYHAQLDGLRR